VRIALVDSGLGLLGTAAALRVADPDVELVLSTDPDGMPWGPRPATEVAERALLAARAAAAFDPDVLVLACNTASVLALEVLRAELEPRLPVVGTVPAIKPAAAGGGPLAVWATPATTGSPYQLGLIERFAAGVPVAEVACPGLAEAVDRGDLDAVGAAIAVAVARTPADVRAVVLGCTHYGLVAEQIDAALGRGVALHDSARAVAAQTLRRAAPARASAPPGRNGAAPLPGRLAVLRSGRLAELPAAALRYRPGRLVASVPA
jgi:glutamate racemase